jgi:hypothetical protein
MLDVSAETYILFRLKFCYCHSNLTKMGICWQILVKLSNMEFHKICLAFLKLLHADRKTDGQTRGS